MHTVLVVDDEPISLRTVARALARDYRLLATTSASEALQWLADQPVAVAVVDQRMPEMSGTELFEICGRRHPEVLRVLLTGYTDLETLMAAINAGHVFSYVAKPWEEHELRLVVRNAIEHFELESDRRRLMAALQGACDELARENRVKDRLLMLAAHELGTPLHLIGSALDVWASHPGDPTPLAIARRGLDWMGRALAQLRTAGQLQSGELRLDCRKQDLASWIEEVINPYRAALANRCQSFEVALIPDLPTAVFDPFWLGRALANLLSNAIRFSPDGTRIEIRVEAEQQLKIDVCDHGVGIAPEALAHLFELFSPAAGDLDLHRSGGFEFGARGLGLGLAIAQRIALAHGGALEVESRVGIGSRFRLRIPLMPAQV